MTRIPLVAPHWLGADATRWPNSLEALGNFGTILCCKVIELSSGISSKPSVGVGLRSVHGHYNLSYKKYVDLTSQLKCQDILPVRAVPGRTVARWAGWSGRTSSLNTATHCQGQHQEHRRTGEWHKYTSSWSGTLQRKYMVRTIENGTRIVKIVSRKSAMRQKRELAILVKDFCDGSRVTGEEGETYSVICCQSQCSLRSGIAEGIICFYCCLKWTT